MAPFNFLIDLPVRNEWENVDLLRSSILNCFTAVFHDIDGCQAVAMVAGELMENAIKYGSWSGGDSPFRLRVWGREHQVNVSVENPVDADSVGVTELFRILKWMESFETPEDAYRAKLLEAAQTPREVGMSGLGLVRVAYEGNCRLKAELSGQVLCVTGALTV